MKLSEIHIRDPYIFAEDGVYYLYGTRIGVNGVPKPCTGLDVYTSRDLEDWSEPYECFTRPDDFWANWDFFAPEVHKYKGKYYMFASFRSATHNRASHILVADSPMGKFLPIVPEAITPEDRVCLDATFYVDENGTPYTVFVHEWTQIHDGSMCALQLTDDLKYGVGEPVTLFHAGEAEWKYGIENGENYVTDGPFLRKNKAGKLTMIWSGFTDHCFYVEATAVSDSGNIMGPWRQVKEPIFKDDGGHGMIFEGFDGKLYMVIHTPNVRPRERAVIFEIEETEDSYRIISVAHK